ncbi:MAG: glycosyltransferase, partial [Solirubrobacteraceae bacterium]
RMIESLRVADRVRLLPHRADPARTVADADVVLMCSQSEALGRVTVEAMKLGRPVTGAAGGATPELVRHGFNGFLYRPGDPDDLARWLSVCAQDRGSLGAMGERGRSWARETFNRERYGAELEAALASAL